MVLLITITHDTVMEEISDVKFWLHKRHKERDNEIMTISSGGITNIIKFYHYLYNESSIYMDRKKDKFERWFNWYFDNIKRPHNKTLELKSKYLNYE